MKDYLTWEDVLKRDDIIGGTIKIYEENHIYRGPITAFKIQEERLFIYCKKVERTLSTNENEFWKPSVCKSFSWNKSSLPTPIANDCVSFIISKLSFGIIYPKGFKFESAKVKRLKT